MKQSSTIQWVAILALVTALDAMSASASSGDRIRLSTQGGNTIATLSGPESSAAAEIYAVLDKAGTTDTQPSTGHAPGGELIQASVLYVDGTVYSADFTINAESSYGLLPSHCAPASACANSAPKLIIGGDVAQELFQDMEKAGDPITHGINQGAVMGQNLICSFLIAGKTRYSCSIKL